MHPNTQSGPAQEVINCHPTAQSSAFNNSAKQHRDRCNLRLDASHRPAIPPSSDHRKKSQCTEPLKLWLSEPKMRFFKDEGLKWFLDFLKGSCFQLYHLWWDASLMWRIRTGVSCSDVPVKDLESARLICKEERIMCFYITVSSVTTGHIYINFFIAGATPQVGQRSAIVQYYWKNI